MIKIEIEIDEQVQKIDPVRNLIYVKGCVPGNDGEYVKITDGRNPGPFVLPFPTYDYLLTIQSFVGIFLLESQMK